MGKFSAAAMAAGLDAKGALLNGGTIQIRTGAAPANAEDAATGSLLATCTLSATAFLAAVPTTGVGASITADTITEDSDPTGGGNAGHYRALDSGGNCVDQGSVGVSGSGADMIVPSVTVTAHVAFGIDSYVISQAC